MNHATASNVEKGSEPADKHNSKKNKPQVVNGSKSRRISHPHQTPFTELIDHPTDNDILLGRGGYNNKFVGNERLRDFAMEYVEEYLGSTKSEKTHLAKTLVQRIRSLDPPGRFLKKIETGQWIDIGDDLARDKASQVLRDAVRDIPEYEETRQRTLDVTSQNKTSNSPRENPNAQDILRFVTTAPVAAAAAASSSCQNQEHMSSFIPTFPTHYAKYHLERAIDQDVTTKKRPHSEMLLGESNGYGNTNSTSAANHDISNASTFRYAAASPVQNTSFLSLPEAVPSRFKGNNSISPIGSESNLMSTFRESTPFLFPAAPNLFSSLQRMPPTSDLSQQTFTVNQNDFTSNPQYNSQAYSTGLLQTRLESLRQRYLHEIKSEINSYQKFGAIPAPNLTTSEGRTQAFQAHLQALQQQYQMIHEHKMVNPNYVPDFVPSQSNQISEVASTIMKSVPRETHETRRIVPLNRGENMKNISDSPSMPESVVESSSSNKLPNTVTKNSQSDDCDDSRLKLLCATVECVEKYKESL